MSIFIAMQLLYSIGNKVYYYYYYLYPIGNFELGELTLKQLDHFLSKYKFIFYYCLP